MSGLYNAINMIITVMSTPLYAGVSLLGLVKAVLVVVIAIWLVQSIAERVGQ